jgi:DNA-binding transcriptional ArsR family regulator
MSIARLTEDFDVTRQAISKHLRVMEQAGLLRHARRGRETVWRLSPRRLEDARRYLGMISKQWDDSLARLRRLVEE